MSTAAADPQSSPALLAVLLRDGDWLTGPSPAVQPSSHLLKGPHMSYRTSHTSAVLASCKTLDAGLGVALSAHVDVVHARVAQDAAVIVTADRDQAQCLVGHLMTIGAKVTRRRFGWHVTPTTAGAAPLIIEIDGRPDL